MFTKPVRFEECPVFESSKLLCGIDQYDAQDFNLNECGFIRNDISKLARAQSQSEFDALMKKIGSNPASYNVKDGMTLAEAFDRIRPRNLQSPSELAQFAEYMANVDATYAKVLDSSPAQPSVEKPSVESASASES